MLVSLETRQIDAWAILWASFAERREAEARAKLARAESVLRDARRRTAHKGGHAYEGKENVLSTFGNVRYGRAAQRPSRYGGRL